MRAIRAATMREASRRSSDGGEGCEGYAGATGAASTAGAGIGAEAGRTGAAGWEAEAGPGRTGVGFGSRAKRSSAAVMAPTSSSASGARDAAGAILETS